MTEYDRTKEPWLRHYEHITDPIERVKALFENTKEEDHMGGGLIQCVMIADNLVGIQSHSYMDANMFHSLMALLNGRIVFGSLDTIVIKIKEEKEYGKS